MYRPNRIGPLPILTLNEEDAFYVGPPGSTDWGNWSTANTNYKAQPIIITDSSFGLPRANVYFDHLQIPTSEQGTIGSARSVAFGLPVMQTVLTDKFNFPPDGYILQIWGQLHVWSINGQGAMVADGFFVMQTQQDKFRPNGILEAPLGAGGHRWWVPSRTDSINTVGSGGVAARFTSSVSQCNTSVIIQPSAVAIEGTPFNLVICASMKNFTDESATIGLYGTLGYSFYDRDLQVFDPTM